MIHGPSYPAIQGKSPNIDPSCFIASSADIIGDVTIGENSSVWYQCVLRGDVMPIEIGKMTNIQDGTVIHGTYKQWGVKIGDNVTVGHQAMLHGCEIGDQAFIGMGAILLDGVKVAPRTFIGAGAMLTQGTETQSEYLYLGSPAKPVRKLKEEEMAFLPQSAKNYLMYTQWYEKG